MNQKTFYITTPIYYPSGELHIGHVYSTSIAWVIRNYKKIRGYETKFLTGSDEHGQKIAQKATELNLNPQIYVNQMAQKFKDLWKAFKIDYDLFSRTTDINHQQTVQKIFDFLIKNNDIYFSNYQGLYSIQDEEFLTKTQAILKENGKYYHPISNHLLEVLTEESYFLKLSRYQSWLKEYWTNHPQFIVPKKTVTELSNNFLDKGLENLSITRTTFSWGIPILENNNPSPKKHYIYVWLDALCNYISALGYEQKTSNLFEKFWKNGTEIVHVVGKEISRFHCIYWPIILKALNLRLPNTILSHGWLITNEGKMSKSKGNIINPFDLLKDFDPEIIKYYLVSQINIGSDGIFKSELIKTIYNSDLANNFGNLISRTLTLIANNFPSGISDIYSVDISDSSISQLIINSQKQYQSYFDNFEISESLKVAISLSKKLNLYIEKTTPWSLTDNLKALSEILINLLNGIYCIGLMLSVVMPEKMTILQNQLKIKKWNWDDIINFKKFYNIKLIKNEPLFLRIK